MAMTLEMLAAYYSKGCDSRELFQGRKIEGEESFHENLNQFDVIYLNMQQFLIRSREQGLTSFLEHKVIAELYEEYGELLYF